VGSVRRWDHSSRERTLVAGASDKAADGGVELLTAGRGRNGRSAASSARILSSGVSRGHLASISTRKVGTPAAIGEISSGFRRSPSLTCSHVPGSEGPTWCSCARRPAASTRRRTGTIRTVSLDASGGGLSLVDPAVGLPITPLTGELRIPRLHAAGKQCGRSPNPRRSDPAGCHFALTSRPLQK